MIHRTKLAVSLLAALATASVSLATAVADPPDDPGDVYSRWANGPGRASPRFPIAVWLQAPANAARYKAIGVNVYVGLWQGPTAEQLDELERQGMPVICAQNEYARAHLDRKIIVGWMHGDEPDNAQSLGQGRGYGPPIPPQNIVEDYQQMTARDPSRPVLLNLGQGVAWDGWHGRGVRTNHPEDYTQYVQGGDIVSFDIYPVVHDRPAVTGKLEYVARGVSRLRQWAGDRRIVWNCIECTRISNPDVKPTPQQVKAEVWMSIIHGSQGIIYFCHQFQPRFIEAALLADEQLAGAVGEINRQIQELAPVLCEPTLDADVTVQSQPPGVSDERAAVWGLQPVAVMGKKSADAHYLFAVRMGPTPCSARLQIPGIPLGPSVQVIGEERTIQAETGGFEDEFGAYEVHLYRIPFVR